MKKIFAPFGANEKAAEAAYHASTSKDVQALGLEVASDAMMAEPARFVAQTLSSNGVPVWEFRFSYVAESMRKELAGAPNATDVPFVFDTARAHYGVPLTQADEKTAQEMNTYWANFIKTGNPNGAGLVTLEIPAVLPLGRVHPFGDVAKPADPRPDPRHRCVDDD